VINAKQHQELEKESRDFLDQIYDSAQTSHKMKNIEVLKKENKALKD